jgi:two-component system, NarL family, nitrate/nitrite response regulator NarL
MTVRVLVVSDVRIVQEGVRLLLAQHAAVEVVSTADAAHARAETEKLHPDVVLFDATRADAACAHELVAELPGSRIIAFGVRDTDEHILALAAAGTAGYVREGAPGTDVVAVLERVMCDELPCSARAAASLYRQVAKLSHRVREGFKDTPPRGAAQRAAGRDASLALARLSRRELEIAHLIDCGLSNKEIARRLGIAAVTVKNHVHNLCEKLEVHRRGAALARLRSLLRAQSLSPTRKGPPRAAREADAATLEASASLAPWFLQ